MSFVLNDNARQPEFNVVFFIPHNLELLELIGKSSNLALPQHVQVSKKFQRLSQKWQVSFPITLLPGIISDLILPEERHLSSGRHLENPKDVSGTSVEPPSLSLAL